MDMCSLLITIVPPTPIISTDSSLQKGKSEEIIELRRQLTRWALCGHQRVMYVYCNGK